MEKRKTDIRSPQRLPLKILLGLLLLAIFVDAESPLTPESSSLEQESASSDLHKRQLSPSEQAQILSDVQQHQSRFGRVANPIQNLQITSPFPSLAKYKVDRAKQQQELLQQRQQQQLQQQNSNQQRIQNFFETAQTQYQPQAVKQQQQYQQILQSQPQFSQYNQNLPVNNAKYLNLNQPLFNGGQNIQLQSYFEKQRQLEFLQKQRERLLAEQQELRRQQELLRLQQLQQLQTTTSTTTPVPFRSTFSPLLLSSPSARKITSAESDLFLKAIASHQKKFSSTTSSPPVATTTTTLRTTTVEASPILISRGTARGKVVDDKQEIPKDILSLIEAQESQGTSNVSQNRKSKPQIQIIYQTEKPPAGAIRQKSSAKSKSSQSSAQREALLKQLKLALLQSPEDEAAKNISTRDLVLPNGKTVQVIRAPNGLPSVESQLTSESLKEVVKASLPTTSIRPPNAILEELTKGVLPPGADFEVLRHKLDGNLEEVGKGPLENSPAKKVTFVVLEEQPDGSYKVQGVKGNADKENGGDVESIVERIKNGELKLPPPSVKPSSPTAAGVAETITTTRKSSTITNTPTVITGPPPTTTYRPQTVLETGRNMDFSKSSNDRLPFVTISSSSGGSTTDRYVTSATTPSSHVYNSFPSTSRPSVHQTQSYVSKYPVSTRSHFIPTMAPVSEIVTQHPTTTPLPTTTYAEYTTNRYFSPTTYSDFGSKTAASPSPRSIANTPKTNVVYEENYESSTLFDPTSVLTVAPPSSDLAGDNLIRILKRQGLYAMAKFLGQSGLDTVLNDTGPYTIFAPTDKAFRALLVQLGGPEKAEEKFRENPRLLSGLLLHHVIPGAFRIESLQDEMTGVSLAGTQLRVNTYNMQDVEWNDVTTINGARVLPDKQNIEIPQGISHAVDRVMFPLPVGDLVQTLQADRERRFTVFLRALHASGLEETLSGSKTYTIFAPTDNAFMIASASPNGSPPWLDDEDNQEAARAIVSRHVIPTTLFTAGMRYYQQKETLHSQAFLHIHKNSGRIKVNNAKVITYNIPATNGVIHAVDTLL
ncbi:uncharacterized protein LOC124405920 [Diprion similis]|uniref:uncharacterized protein LOC124405920 n=1 Tax=Diprion similis TaxID=362088 RepID=UPI001EF87536|nr:uncharacterized protein LOC124405920 [Diprion similis]